MAPNISDFGTSIVQTAPFPSDSGLTMSIESIDQETMPAVPFDAVVHPANQVPTVHVAEVVTVTDITDNIVTMTRGQLGTSPKNIAAGWRMSAAIFSSHIRNAYDRTYHSGQQAISSVTGLQSSLDAKELLANKSVTTTLGTSDTLYPSQNAVKTYTDNETAKTRDLTFTVGTLAGRSDYVCDGTADQVEINQALSAINAAGGGVLYIKGGSYTISAPIVIYSYTKLVLAPNATINLASGSNCNMLQNANVTPNRSVSDGVLNSTTTLTSATAAFTSADTGSTVIIPAALAGGQMLVTTITYVNPTTVTLAKAAGVSATGKTVTIYRRDSFIEVMGGSWNRGNNSGAGVNLHSLLFRHLSNVYVHDLFVTSTAGKYAINLGDVVSANVSNIRFQTFSDGVHFNGPYRDIVVQNIRGTTGDDLVSFTPADYTTYNDTAGDGVNVNVRDLYGDNALCLLKIIGGTDLVSNNIKAYGLHGTSIESCIRITNDTTGDTNCSGIVIEGCDAAPGTSNVSFVQCEISAGAAKDITLRDFTSRGAYDGVRMVRVRNGTDSTVASVDHLTLQNFRMSGNINSSNNSGIIELFAGTVRRLTIDNVDMSNMTSLRAMCILGNTTLSKAEISNVHIDMPSASGAPVFFHEQGTTSNPFVVMSNIHLSNGGRLYRSSQSAVTLRVICTNVILDNALDLGQAGGPTDFTISNAYVNVSSSSLMTVSGASSSLTVRGRSLNIVGSKAGFNLISTPPAPRVINPSYTVDVAVIAKNVGDQAYNTNAASAAVGPVITQGTYWYSSIPGASVMADYGAAPVAQGAAIADATGTIGSVQSQLNLLLARQRTKGDIAP